MKALYRGRLIYHPAVTSRPGDFAATVQAAKKAGKTPDEVASTYKIPAQYKGYAEPAAARLRANVQVVWDETK